MFEVIATNQKGLVLIASLVTLSVAVGCSHATLKRDTPPPALSAEEPAPEGFSPDEVWQDQSNDHEQVSVPNTPPTKVYKAKSAKNAAKSHKKHHTVERAARKQKQNT